MARADAGQKFELTEEALDLVALTVERLREAGFPLRIDFAGKLGTAPCASIRSRVALPSLGSSEHDCTQLKRVQKLQRGRRVVRLAPRQGRAGAAASNGTEIYN